MVVWILDNWDSAKAINAADGYLSVLYLEILIAFVFAQILFMLSGTTFAPMISAIVLPVMMQTESFIYPIAAFLLTVAVVKIVNTKTTTAVDNISYEQQIQDAISGEGSKE